MSHDQAVIPSEPQVSARAHSAITETLASLARRIEWIEAEQRDQTQSIDHTIVRLEATHPPRAE